MCDGCSNGAADYSDAASSDLAKFADAQSTVCTKLAVKQKSRLARLVAVSAPRSAVVFDGLTKQVDRRGIENLEHRERYNASPAGSARSRDKGCKSLCLDDLRLRLQHGSEDCQQLGLDSVAASFRVRRGHFSHHFNRWDKPALGHRTGAQRNSVPTRRRTGLFEHSMDDPGCPGGLAMAGCCSDQLANVLVLPRPPAQIPLAGACNKHPHLRL